ncbi:ATP-NAD kinase-like domain-containing protein [Hyaloraphidium curvatum]|nr:ATP-NAD kinase-like domain-containing protein [Hyaloraphidium curvatum]
MAEPASPPPSPVALYGRARYFGSSDGILRDGPRVEFELREPPRGAPVFAHAVHWKPIAASPAAPPPRNRLLGKVPPAAGEIGLARVFGASFAASLPPPGAHSPLVAQQRASKSPTKMFLIHSLACSDDPGARLRKGYRVVWHAFECDEPPEAAEWVRVLRTLARGDDIPRSTNGPERAPRAFMLVNPFSGTKAAPKRYRDVVAPMLRLAGFEPHMLETQRAKHAIEIARDLPASDLLPVDPDRPPYARLATVSGDGLFHEMVQGLFARPDWKEVMEHVKIGVVPGGSANAMARNMGEGSGIEGMVRAVIGGRTHPLAFLAFTQHPPGKPHSVTWFSHLELLWAFASDVDIESERQRWAGYARVTVQALVRLVRLREYSARLYWLEEHKEQNPNPADANPCAAGDPPPHAPPPNLPPLRYAHLPVTALTPSNGWRSPPPGTKFVFFTAMNLPWASPDSLFAPEARWDDGYAHLAFTGETDKGKLLGVLTAGESVTEGVGGAKHGWISRVRCRAFVLVPEGRQGRSGTKPGILDVDGEVIPGLPLWCEGTGVRGQVLVPPWFEEGEWGGVRAPWK